MRSSRTALHPRCRHEPQGCDLNSVNETEITPSRAEFRGEGNQLLPSAGPGEGVRPRDTVRRGTPIEGFPQEINAMELSTNLVPALSAPAAGPPFYK